MKGRQLLDAMAYIDDALIEEAAPLPENNLIDAVDFMEKRWKRKGIATCAAVFGVVVVSLWVWKSGIVPHERTVLENEQNAGAYAGAADNGYDPAENAPEAAPIAEQKKNDIVDNAAALKEADAGGEMVSGGIAADTESVREENTQDSIDDLAAQEEKGNAIVRVIEEFHLPAIYCYAVPEKGTIMICAELKSAIDCYDNGNNTIELAEPEKYLYHVTIDVFGETDCDGVNCDGLPGSMVELCSSKEGKEKLYQEYERMRLAGLDVSLSEDYQLTGLLSREEIEGFEPCPDYGYAFRLINES